MQISSVQLYPSLGCSDLQPLPSDFEFLASSVDLISNTAIKLEKLIQQSLPTAKLVSLRRFANKTLLIPYAVRRDFAVANQNGGDANVFLLFDGTKDPSLILGNGLDPNSARALTLDTPEKASMWCGLVFRIERCLSSAHPSTQNEL
jgi:hypothetical protein